MLPCSEALCAYKKQRQPGHISAHQRGALHGRAPASAEAATEAEAAALSGDRVRRLGLLIRLRKLYRNLLRADGLLAQDSPIYCAPAPLPGALRDASVCTCRRRT